MAVQTLNPPSPSAYPNTTLRRAFSGVLKCEQRGLCVWWGWMKGRSLPLLTPVFNVCNNEMSVWQLLLEPKLTLPKTEKSERQRKTVHFIFSFGAVWDVICFLGDCVQPPEPLGSRIVRGGSMLFLHRHLSLSPHNDSPCSPLLMFVIALSHKGR